MKKKKGKADAKKCEGGKMRKMTFFCIFVVCGFVRVSKGASDKEWVGRQKKSSKRKRASKGASEGGKTRLLLLLLSAQNGEKNENSLARSLFSLSLPRQTFSFIVLRF